MTRALLVVDVQNDFVEGSLATARGAEVATGISELLAAHHSYSYVCATQDWHIDPAGHFAPADEEPDYHTTWPVHCVAGQWGARAHKNLRTEFIEQWFHKGEYTAAYSGFEGASMGESLSRALRIRGIEHIDLCGIATDFCVKATALDGLQEGFGVTVLSELCSPVDEQASNSVLSELKSAGAKIQ